VVGRDGWWVMAINGLGAEPGESRSLSIGDNWADALSKPRPPPEKKKKQQCRHVPEPSIGRNSFSAGMVDGPAASV